MSPKPTLTVYSPLFGGGPTGKSGIGVTLGSSSTLYYYELVDQPKLLNCSLLRWLGLSSWLDTGLEAQNNNLPNGRILQLNSGTDVVANNWPSGVTQNLIMVGWSANLGTTWASALNYLQNWSSLQFDGAYFGIGSSVGSLASFSSNPGVFVFGTAAGLVNDGANNPLVMDLLPTPEPGTMALSALGGLSLLAFRRKK